MNEIFNSNASIRRNKSRESAKLMMKSGTLYIDYTYNNKNRFHALLVIDELMI